HWYSLMSNGSGTGIMDQAQTDPNIRFIVTFGHRPAWSTGVHPGDSTLAGYMSTLHASHSKYVLNLNGHSHDYERTDPALTNGATSISGQFICGPAGGGTNDITCNSGDVIDSFTIQ